ncbi:MAG TPA: hypothetical protein VFX33_11375 [Actinomycetales bacterium]|nr:hypothetical protein [Actinomycetales bacterium]
MTPAPQRKAWLSWSSGKDCAWALHEIRSQGDSQGEVDVVGLLTTINSTANRVSMHGVRRALLEKQAASLGLPLHVIELPDPCPNDVYEQRMQAAVDAARCVGVSAIVYGDMFLEDVRAYREQALAGTGIEPLFPLWGKPTHEVARAMLAGGLRALVTCVDPRQAPPELAGRWFDEQLLADLPAQVDPCGENGEFHTFVVQVPQFDAALDVEVGEVVERGGFVFADVLPTGETASRQPDG